MDMCGGASRLCLVSGLLATDARAIDERQLRPDTRHRDSGGGFMGSLFAGTFALNLLGALPVLRVATL